MGRIIDCLLLIPVSNPHSGWSGIIEPLLIRFQPNWFTSIFILWDVETAVTLGY
jgi:hypothetical protein